MKATGIVRRIDDLGRVVVPKEIRRTLRIREGDPLEIYTDREGEIILKKYSPIGELGHIADQCAETIFHSTGYIAVITDRDHIIAVAGMPKKEIINKPISKELEKAINNRKIIKETNNFIQLTDTVKLDNMPQIICPIICEGDIIGSVIILEKENHAGSSETNEKIASVVAGFLGRQMEG